MALNFLVTGVKMLKKSLDKKKMKEKAKKFVGGDKEEKRAKVSKIMDKEGSYGGKSKVKKPASISKSKLMKIDIDKVAKVTPDAAKIDYKAFTQKVDNIVGMTDALAFLTGAQSEQKKDELKLLRQQKEEEKKRKKEAKLEKKDGMLKKVGKGIKKAAQSPLDAMINFITKIALGALALFLINNADKIKAIFKNIGENLEGFSKLLRVTIFGFKEGMKLAKAGLNLLGKGAKKLLSPVGKAFKAIELEAGISFPQTVVPPSPSKISPAFKFLFATDTASPINTFVDPVDLLSNKAVATLKPNSDPIKCIGLHSAAYSPLSSTGTPYSLKHCSVYLESDLKTTNTPQRKLSGISLPSLLKEDTTSTVPELSNIPPNSFGFKTFASLEVPTAGKSSPFSGTFKPVALANAPISIADLVPSKNELNILGFNPPAFASCSDKP